MIGVKRNFKVWSGEKKKEGRHAPAIAITMSLPNIFLNSFTQSCTRRKLCSSVMSYTKSAPSRKSGRGDNASSAKKMKGDKKRVGGRHGYWKLGGDTHLHHDNTKDQGHENALDRLCPIETFLHFHPRPVLLLCQNKRRLMSTVDGH